MAMTVHCDIVSAEESLFSGLVEMVIVTGVEGELGLSYGHAQLLTALKPGPARIIKSGGEEEVLFLSGGYAEVQPNSINILADVAEREIGGEKHRRSPCPARQVVMGRTLLQNPLAGQGSNRGWQGPLQQPALQTRKTRGNRRQADRETGLAGTHRHHR